MGNSSLLPFLGDLITLDSLNNFGAKESEAEAFALLLAKKHLRRMSVTYTR